MTTKTVQLTSYDVPSQIKETINAMQTLEEVEAYRSSVKSPSECTAGDPDLEVWWACTAVLRAEQRLAMNAIAKAAPVPSEEQLRIADWVLSDEYDEE